MGKSAPGSTSSLSPADAILCKCEATAPVRRLQILPEPLDNAAWKSGIVTEDFRYAMSAPLDDFDPSEFGGHGV